MAPRLARMGFGAVARPLGRAPMVETKPSLTVGLLPRDAQSHCIVKTSVEEFAGHSTAVS
jgi:hypothetical protein